MEFLPKETKLGISGVEIYFLRHRTSRLASKAGVESLSMNRRHRHVRSINNLVVNWLILITNE